MRKITQFQQRVYAAARKIPQGKVATYADIARAIGLPGAARAVGNALNKNPFAPQVPCHRVVKSNGQVGGFANGSKNKAALLRIEGIAVHQGKIVDFVKVRKSIAKQLRGKKEQQKG